MKTETNTQETMNQNPNNKDAIVSTDSPEHAQQPDNTARLAELAEKIHASYNERHKCGGKMKNWKTRQLKAGIELGDYLLEAKSLAPDKQFMAWCRDNFPKLCHRTLTRYMKIAVNRCETHVSSAGGLRQAYKACAAKDQQTESPEKSEFARDVGTIKRQLIKALNCLNNHTDIATSGEADDICALVDALNNWATDYRDRTERQSLNKHRDEEFEMSLADEKESSTPAEGTEIVVVE